MLNTAREVIEVCEKDNIHIYDLVLREETLALKITEEEMRDKVREVLEVMKKSSQETLEKSFETEYKMIDGFAKTMNALMAAKEKYGLDDEVLINGLLTSIGIGQIIGKYATFAGAEGGCQAECGSASAMAAAALVEMLGGSPEEALNAASITLINVMGLACDPIAGLVEYPCTFRNASGVMNSFISTDMALAGIKSIVPFDEVCQAMGEVGHLLHESIRETGLGGLAGTKTGQEIRAKFLNIKED